MIPFIEELIKRYRLPNPIIVADAGLMNKSNIAQLCYQGLGFILGARIKNTSQELTSQILALKLAVGQKAIIITPEGYYLVVHYSAKRATKYNFDRGKGIDRARKMVQRQNLTKDKSTNHGYKKFLQIKGKAELVLDHQKHQRGCTMGWTPGHLTNTVLTEKNVIARYRDLWEVERRFKITKYDLEARLLSHRLETYKRAHLCDYLAALKVEKKLDKQLRKKKLPSLRMKP